MQTFSARRNLWTLLFLLLTGAPLLRGQVADSSISGHVFDPSGRVISGARIAAENSGRGTIRTITADANGGFSLIGLEPAVYAVSAKANGFSDSERTGVLLAVDTAMTLDFHLVVGGPDTRVEVNEPASYLQIQTADLGTVIDQKSIDTLPLNARNFLQLAFL